MKLVTAIVRPDRLDALVTALADSGARGVTVTEVRGFGRQYGQLTHAIQAAGRDPGISEHPVALLPKARLDLVVHDDDAAGVIQAIVKSTGSGTIGDGKIWVAPLDSVIRVRTGELDDAAI
jgi:nitrogen regulatory protein P-II 1